MAQKTCPNLKENQEKCPCTSEDCPRRGTCCECLRAHLANGSLPACAHSLGAEASR